MISVTQPALLLVTLLMVLSFVLTGHFDCNWSTVFLSTEITSVYVGNHHSTKTPGSDDNEITVREYTHDQLVSFRQRSVIDPAGEASIVTLRLQPHRAGHRQCFRMRGWRIGARVQRPIKILHVVTTSNHATLSIGCIEKLIWVILLLLNFIPDVKPIIAISRTQRHMILPVRCLWHRSLDIRFMQNKIDDLDNLMQERQLHILAVMKTWHEDVECITIKRLRCLGYNFIEAARPKTPQTDDEDNNYINHGGIVLISKQWIVVAKIDLKLKASSFEYLCCCIK